MIASTNKPEATERDIEYLPARMLNEFTYCPRLFYLEHIDGLFAHNSFTVEGQSKHQRVDSKTDELPPSSELDQQEKIHARSVTLASDQYGIVAKLDLIEANGNVATPIDYKRGSPKTLEDGSLSAWDPERVQICAQALVLREHGFQCDEGILYFWATRQRVRVASDDALVTQTVAIIAAARELESSGVPPLPLVNSPKCPHCSLVSICLPDEITRCAQADASNSGLVQSMLFDIGPQFGNRNIHTRTVSDDLRQLITPRDDKRPLYLNTQGYYVSISNQVLKIKEKDKVVQEARLNDLNQVNLFGNVQMSTQAIQALLAAEIPLVYFSFGGWFHGMTQPLGLKNILWRREQFRKADRQDFCLMLARQLVSGKIRNQRTLLMRNHVEPPNAALRYLKKLDVEANAAESLASLLGIEGLAARVYFEHFTGMIKVALPETADGDAAKSPLMQFDFTRRNRRPPRDPINALLSLGYSLLAKDLTIAATTTGLDPLLGFYHQPRAGRPALALDLMEPFRPLIVDSVVLSSINQRMVTPEDFVRAGDAVALTASGRKGFFRAYEQRMDQLVMHPLFGYRVSYRRMLEIQTRLLARVLLGEIATYPVFVTR
jgi:CRISPR-associated protein Cas1